MEKAFYRNILLNSSLGYAYHEIIFDSKGVPCDYRFIEVNDAFKQYTGLGAEGIVGKTILEVFPDIIHDEFDWISYYGAIATNNKEETFDEFSEALESWYEVHVFSPKKNFFVTIFSNISKSKKQTQNIINLDTLFSNVVKNAPIPLMIHRDDGKVVNISDSWSEISGYKHTDIPNIEEWTKAAYGQEQKKVADFIEQLYLLDEPQHDGEFWIKSKEGTKLLWDFYSTYIGSTINNKRLAMSVAFDVTKERKMKEDLYQQQQLFETTLLSIGDGVICTNKKGEVTLINNIGEKLTGYTLEYALGKKMEEIFSIYDERTGLESENIVKKVIQTGKMQKLSNHTILQSKTGKKRPIADSAAPIMLQNGEIVGVVVVFRDFTDKYNAEKQIERLVENLKTTQMLLEASLNSPVDIIILSLDTNYNYLFFNEAHRLSMKQSYNAEVETGKNLFDYMNSEEEIKRAKVNYSKALAGTMHTTTEVYGSDKPFVFETIYSPLKNDHDEIIGVTAYARNITEQINANKRISESEEKYRLLYSSMNQGLALHEIILDEGGHPIDYIYLDINDSYTELLGVTREQCIGKRITEVMPKVESYWIRTFGKVALTGEPMYYENYLETTKRYYSTYSYSPKKGQFAVLVSDITERIEREEKIEYLSYHDYLTGLYNRRFYEEELLKLDVKDNLPISLIMGDVNGLKLVNDSFGHQVGDELLTRVARILEEACRASDIIARIGGDEFVIILPKTKEEDAAVVIDRITTLTKSEKVESIDVSISFGYGTKTSKEQRFFDLFKEIEDEMYSNKLTQSRSMRSKTINIIMQSLFEKNDREMKHSERVSNLCEKLAKKLGLDADDVKQVKTAGLMHDIGKIGIDEEILNKAGKLTEPEWSEIKRHPEVGYRILSSVDEFNDIANYILQHHERWDGSGYPNALKSDEISLQARIINISDAFDAMTSYRTYRPKLTVDQAVQEIKNNIETQFDPHISKIFVTEVLGKKWI